MPKTSTRIAYLKRVLQRLEGEDERINEMILSGALTAAGGAMAFQQLMKSREELLLELRSLQAEKKANAP
jgi:hypothetical protein